MTTVILCSTLSSSSLPPLPPNLNSSPPPSLRHLHHHPHLPSTILPPPPPPPPKFTLSRRNTALSLSIGALFPYIWPASPAAFGFDFDIRISGPKDWLKEQKKKSIKYLLAPIVASREILNYVHQLLLSENSRFEQKDMEDIRGMLNSAARDCVVEERNSLVAFQAKTGVEVCTFKLVVSNASSLLNDDDPTKLDAEARLNDLIRSFTFLNGLAKETSVELVSNRQKVADAVTDTLSTLDKFEQGIKGCIEA
ncbi:hypothetical protein RND81_02G054500 [Saponaria officinalis]|uniref:Chloroplast thylakoid membrane n=1 Tax=Saponaria officinalis TaxID=3572 RepID=A0AAW1MSS8_SAPOF